MAFYLKFYGYLFDRFYESELSIVGDPELGPILASLMVGPCALEFTRLNNDSYWYNTFTYFIELSNLIFMFRFDPPADELVQRHRISSSSSCNTPSKGSLKKTLSSQIVRNLILENLLIFHCFSLSWRLIGGDRHPFKPGKIVNYCNNLVHSFQMLNNMNFVENMLSHFTRISGII